MDKVKEAVPSITLANSAAIAGASLYVYRQLERINNEVKTLNNALTKVVQKINEFDKAKQGNEEVLKDVSSEFETLKKQVTDCSNGLSYVRDDLDGAIEALHDTGVDIEVPSQIPRRRGGYDEYEPRRGRMVKTQQRRTKEDLRPPTHKSVGRPQADNADDDIINSLA